MTPTICGLYKEIRPISSHPPNWDSVEALFNRALELPAAQRPQFLEEACAGDAGLREAVETLLAHDGTDDIGADIVSEAARLFVHAPALGQGTVIGAYRILDTLGQGGMGDVYLAERSDQAFSKQVAIKLIRTRLYGGDDAAARFAAERQILATLEHPNIARLLDGGSTADGTPYLVMEYIQGLPIDVFCERHKLDLRQRLQLFRRVCGAVDYAHQHLVVHRDIKPSNILVNAAGEPRLLDFGIAKILDQSRVDASQPQTAVAERLLTPHYSSPEQLRGEAVSTASDVYALGVVLYELLTGHRPFEREDIPDHAVIRAILEDSPTAPSQTRTRTRGGPGADRTGPEPMPGYWPRQLKGDLDNICLMALRREPDRRYPSAALLGQDIDNYLARRPVRARPASFGYVASRFIARNRVASAAMCLLALSITVSGAILVKQAESLRQQRDLARQQLQRAGAISGFLEDMFQGVDPERAQGREISVREILDSASGQLDTPVTDAPRPPEVTAALQRVIGASYTALAQLPQAEEHLDAAIRLHRSGEVNDTREQILAMLALADLYSLQFRNAEKLELSREALALARRLEPPDPALILDALNRYAGALHMTGKLEASLAQFAELYRETGALYGPQHRNTLTAQLNIGVLNHWLERYDQAQAYYQACYDTGQAALGERHPVTMSCLSALGSVLETRGHYAEAEPLIRRHIPQATAVYGADHPVTLRSRHNYADTLRGLGRLQEAEAEFLTVLARRREVLGREHIETLQTQAKLARLYRQQGRFDEALALLEDSYRLQSEQLGPLHPTAQVTRKILDETYRELGELK
ncbi:protein kinase domain-containing protein [Haliea sp. E17]|uniref:protein kinase domain-containing protein n=1 Tax=Haliea sp. E17 TaxID=3401576 RepID=UPI003AAEEFF4